MRTVQFIGLISFLILSSVIVFLLTEEEPPRNFNFILKFGIDGKNAVNTFEGTLTKDMIIDPSLTTEFTFPPNQIELIHAKMKDIGFFTYPDYFNPPGEVGMRPPVISFEFYVEYGARSKKIVWHDYYASQTIEAVKLRELINMIVVTVVESPEFNKLPEAFILYGTYLG